MKQVSACLVLLAQAQVELGKELRVVKRQKPFNIVRYQSFDPAMTGELVTSVRA